MTSASLAAETSNSALVALLLMLKASKSVHDDDSSVLNRPSVVQLEDRRVDGQRFDDYRFDDYSSDDQRRARGALSHPRAEAPCKINPEVRRGTCTTPGCMAEQAVQEGSAGGVPELPSC